MLQPRTNAPAPKNLAGPGLRAFLRLSELWNLDQEAQRTLLGSPSRATWHRWRKAPPTDLSRDTLERLSYLLGIWKALKILIPDATQATAWVRRPNADPLFGGRPPLERMLQGRLVDLADVRRHLDAARGVW